MNNPNNILLFEYILSDAKSWRTTSTSMRREAMMMLAAVVEDYRRWMAFTDGAAVFGSGRVPGGEGWSAAQVSKAVVR